MKKNQKKNAREKRVLIGALLVAAVTVAGSTFAWMSSQDEVTNRLSASADYNTAITEDFTPPDNIVPGQEINKDAGIINTGNTDAIIKLTPSATINLTFDKATALPTGDTPDFTGFVMLTADEAKAMQAGGMLAFTGKSALAAVGGSEGFTCTVSGKATTDASATDPVAAYDTNLQALQVSSENFKPRETGYYVFKRDFERDTDTKRYSGYYAVVSGETVTYYALATENYVNTDTSGSTVGTTPFIPSAKAAAEQAPELLKPEELNDQPVTLTYDATTAGKEVIKATYTVAGYDTPLTFTIKLQNIGDGTVADKWQNVGSSSATPGSFYYTNDLEAGTTSAMLIDSVVFDANNTFPYRTIDFDLDLVHESVQVVTADDGTELLPGAAAAATKQPVLGIQATATNTAKEITTIKWAAE